MFKRCLSTKSLHRAKECYRQLDICFASACRIRCIERVERRKHTGCE
nr:MAG TPA: hypothetical protein [Caudoviricetes sp.]